MQLIVVYIQPSPLTSHRFHSILETVLQLSVKSEEEHSAFGAASVADLRRGERGILESLDLPEDQALRLMELGFLPGAQVEAALSAPGGDPRVYRVDGSEFALRRETAARLKLQRREQP
jgi:ferrous iron transport protein A